VKPTKNKRRIDPRYFLNETADRDSRPLEEEQAESFPGAVASDSFGNSVNAWPREKPPKKLGTRLGGKAKEIQQRAMKQDATARIFGTFENATPYHSELQGSKRVANPDMAWMAGQDSRGVVTSGNRRPKWVGWYNAAISGFVKGMPLGSTIDKYDIFVKELDGAVGSSARLTAKGIYLAEKRFIGGEGPLKQRASEETVDFEIELHVPELKGAHHPAGGKDAGAGTNEAGELIDERGEVIQLEESGVFEGEALITITFRNYRKSVKGFGVDKNAVLPLANLPVELEMNPHFIVKGWTPQWPAPRKLADDIADAIRTSRLAAKKNKNE